MSGWVPLWANCLFLLTKSPPCLVVVCGDKVGTEVTWVDKLGNDAGTDDVVIEVGAVVDPTFVTPVLRSVLESDTKSTIFDAVDASVDADVVPVIVVAVCADGEDSVIVVDCTVAVDCKPGFWVNPEVVATVVDCGSEFAVVSIIICPVVVTAEPTDEDAVSIKVESTAKVDELAADTDWDVTVSIVVLCIDCVGVVWDDWSDALESKYIITKV